MLKKRFLICLALLVALLVANLVMIQAASSSDLTFIPNSSGDGYIVSDCKSTATGVLSIPATYNNKPVVEIGREAFLDCTGLTSVTIPSSVKTIGWYAFSGCTGLTNISIPDSVTTLDWFAFANCTGLTKVTVGNGVTCIDASAFAGCTKLTNVTLGNGVTNIGWSAFKGCTKLSINIPHSVTTIERYAFYNCDNLSSVTYCGTGEEWSAITKHEGNDALNSATVTYHKYSNCVCSICQDTKHTPAQAVTENEKAATCETAGSYDSVVYCSSCNTKLSSTTVSVPAKDHNMQETQAAVDATCTTAGKTAVLTCANGCGLTIGGDSIPATGEHVDDNGDGACDSCGEVLETTDANLKFYRANASSPYGQLKLTGEVIAYVTAARKGYDSYYVVFTYDNQGNTVTVTAEPSSSSDANYVLFDCAIPAPLMTADITATIYGVKDGVTYQGETIVYTIRECVDAKLNMWYASYGKNAQIAKLFDTLVNLLNYGAQAQTRFGVNTDKLATDGLPAEYAAKIKTDPVELNAYPAVDESGKAATLYNMSFKLQEKINMYGNFLVKSGFTAASDYTVKIVHTKADGSTVTYTITDLTKSGNYLYFEFSKLAPAQMRDELQITLYQKGVAVSATYIRSGDRVVNTLPAPLAALANAIMHYSDCAKAAFG